MRGSRQFGFYGYCRVLEDSGSSQWDLFRSLVPPFGQIPLLGGASLQTFLGPAAGAVEGGVVRGGLLGPSGASGPGVDAVLALGQPRYSFHGQAFVAASIAAGHGRLELSAQFAVLERHHLWGLRRRTLAARVGRIDGDQVQRPGAFTPQGTLTRFGPLDVAQLLHR